MNRRFGYAGRDPRLLRLLLAGLRGSADARCPNRAADIVHIPFLVILFGRLLFSQPLRVRTLLGAGFSYVGLFVMFASAPTRLAPAVLAGGALVAVAAVTFALYQLFARELILRCGATLFTAITMARPVRWRCSAFC